MIQRKRGDNKHLYVSVVPDDTESECVSATVPSSVANSGSDDTETVSTLSTLNTLKINSDKADAMSSDTWVSFYKERGPQDEN